MPPNRTPVDTAALVGLLRTLSLTQSRFASLAGLSRGYISLILRGSVNPSAISRSVLRSVLLSAGADQVSVDRAVPSAPRVPKAGHALYVQHTPPEVWRQVHYAAREERTSIKGYIERLYLEAASVGSHPLALVRRAIAAGRALSE